MQDIKTSEELLAQEREYTGVTSPHRNNHKILNILKFFTREELAIILAFDPYTFTCVPMWAGDINKLREVWGGRQGELTDFRPSRTTIAEGSTCGVAPSGLARLQVVNHTSTCPAK